MRHTLAVALVILTLGTGWPARAAERPTVVAATLDNGLRVLLLEDHRSPIVTVQTWYRVGSRNEARGGDRHRALPRAPDVPRHRQVRPRRVRAPGRANGGQDNAFTSQDVTSYYVNIAADRLDLVLELEADRMHNLLLDPKIIESEREVVIEERRTRTEDDPGGFLGEEVSALAFRAHPYGQPIIGWMEDLKRITPEEIRAFYKTYYVPNNAIVVVGRRLQGRGGPGQGEGGVRRGFRAAPSRRACMAVEPRPERRAAVLVRGRRELPIVYLGYHVPNQTSADAAALEVLSVVLAGGRSSRLYRDLVHERQLALEAGGDYSYFSLDPNLFWFWATPLPGQTPETLEKELLGRDGAARPGSR